MVLGLGRKKQANPEQKKGLFKRLSSGLAKTRQRFASGVSTLLLGEKEINDELIEELETYLLSADIGLDATNYFIQELTKQVSRQSIDDSNTLLNTLKAIMVDTLKVAEAPLIIDPEAKPFTIMMIGVNGSGKTTTTGKLTKRLLEQNHSVMLAAADTFRAAAVEQLQKWGEHNQVPVVAQETGADSAAVCFDALHSAQSRQVEVLVADTAGRLHTQDHLMEELKKIKRVMHKVDNQAPHETCLVLDASIGQNALQQARLFHEAVGITSVCITKLDGTAKAGIIFAIVKELGLPIRFIGVGEQSEDLQTFIAQDFVDALFEES